MAPTEEISAVTQVPIFCPIMIGIAAPKEMAPVLDSACNIPTDAEEDCTIAVSRVPARTPRMGFVNSVRSFAKSGSPLSTLTASDIRFIPTIRTAKPSRIFPTSLVLLFLPNIVQQIPISASTGIHASGLSQLSQAAASAPPSIPLSAVIHEVTAVPTLAPIITPTA